MLGLVYASPSIEKRASIDTGELDLVPSFLPSVPSELTQTPIQPPSRSPQRSCSSLLAWSTSRTRSTAKHWPATAHRPSRTKATQTGSGNGSFKVGLSLPSTTLDDETS